MTESFSLRASDKQSETWARLRAHCQERVAFWRQQNDGDHDAVKTALIRGQIAAYKALLELEREPIPPPG